MRAPPADMDLWHTVQRIVYPRAALPSNHPPFPSETASPKRRPASWLYFTLLDDAQLRAKVLP
jgi:hypothetical protein